MAGGTIRTSGLRELVRAFGKMEKDLQTELTRELQEAAEPVRELATQVILGGGAGLGAMVNVPQTPTYARMKIGVSGKGIVYIAPDWRPGGIGTRRPNLGAGELKRMQAAVDDRADAIVDRLDQMLERMADDWGSL